MFYKKYLKSKLSLIKHLLICGREASQDIWAYFTSAYIFQFNERHYGPQLESQIVRLSHVIEKGLAMPDFKPRSGTHTVSQLARLIQDPKTTMTVNPEQIDIAKCVLHAYYEKHQGMKIDVSDLFEWSNKNALEPTRGGVKKYSKPSTEDAEAFARVFKTRTSVRQLNKNHTPSRETVNHCVKEALLSPSVCNRQTWRVHAFADDKIDQILAYQNGNKGFGHTIPLLLIVTVDMRYFCGAEERFQPWIEGGIFSMSLMLNLHAHGLANVPLNWSVLNNHDKKMRHKTGIPDHERTIMFIGVGHANNDATVAISTRQQVSRVIKWHTD